MIFWYQKINFWYQKMCEFLIAENDFLISENQFLISESHFLISEIIFWYQKLFFDIRKCHDFLISESIFSYQKIISDITKSWYFRDIRKSALKSSRRSIWLRYRALWLGATTWANVESLTQIYAAKWRHKAPRNESNIFLEKNLHASSTAFVMDNTHTLTHTTHTHTPGLFPQGSKLAIKND